MGRIPLIDLTGQRFGRLLVLGLSASAPQPRINLDTVWACRCDCGNECTADWVSLRSSGKRSCGCWRREASHTNRLKHGASCRGKKRAEYRIWTGMIVRCYNQHAKAFPRYGARGIVVCDQWRHSFEAFLADMGARPSPEFSIDRIDNEGNYEPGNCRWASISQQTRNRRSSKFLTFRGETLCISDWAKRLGLNRSTLDGRLQRLPLEMALTRPLRRHAPYRYKPRDRRVPPASRPAGRRCCR